MPISIAGSRRAAIHRRPLSGFTLVELLVVLAIMAFATLAVAPSLQRMTAPRAPRLVVDDLLESIARSRDEAIQRRHTFRGFLDPANKLWQDADGKILYQAPEDVSIFPEDGASTEPMPCIFRPDGSGCNLSLITALGDSEWLLKVDPVTGRIRLQRFLVK